MKKSFLYLAVVFLAVTLMAAQDTGGDKATSGPVKPKPMTTAHKKGTTTHKKGAKGGKKSTVPDDWAGTGSGSGTSKKKSTGNDDWEGTGAAKKKKGHKNTNTGKNSTNLKNAPGTEERPAVPPPTRPTDPK